MCTDHGAGCAKDGTKCKFDALGCQCGTDLAPAGSLAPNLALLALLLSEIWIWNWLNSGPALDDSDG